MKTETTRHFRVHGHVQGVGFRYRTQQEANRLGLQGWVRNCPDNTVEATATGTDVLLDAFEKWLQYGPQGAKVVRVESTTIEREEEPELAPESAGFEILR